MKKSMFALAAAITAVLSVSCAMNMREEPALAIPGMDGEPADKTAWEAEVSADFNRVVASLGTPEAARAMADYDAKYNTSLSGDFARQISATARSSGSGSSDFPPLSDMPFSVDGAVYLSGGAADIVGGVIGWVAPKNFPGGYYHGAVLDKDKADPNNPDAASLQTAIPKGAGYESMTDWRTKINAAVLNPNESLVKTKLDAAQSALHYYCKPENTNMEYGFFKNYVNIFNVVTKEDMYTWYCTKVVWHVYNKYGINVDSNDARVDFTKSGLYSLVNAYYKTIYFYSSSKANAAIKAYIADARQKIVLAEEILLSPNLSKVYERIRE